MPPTPESIPTATGGKKSGLKKIPWWGWGIGIGVASGLGFWLMRRRSAASSSSSSSATATGCSCSDGSTPSPNTSEGTCSDGSTPTCAQSSSGDVGYLVGGDDADTSGALLQAIDDLQSDDKATSTTTTTKTGTTTSTPTKTSSGASPVEGKKYGSGYYTRGTKTPAGYEFLGFAGPGGSNAGGYTGPIYYEKALGKETRKGKTKLLIDTPEYRKKVDRKDNGAPTSTKLPTTTSTKKAA